MQEERVNLTSNDKEFIENLYKSFLINLKYLFKNKQIKNALDCYKILTMMLRNGQFSIEKRIDFNDNFKYLPLSNTNYSGIQVMYGICCCRHVSAFINDILTLLGFNTSLYYVQIDENNNWHPCSIIDANHVTILLKDNNKEYILDPTNNFILKKESDQSLTLLNFDLSPLKIQQFMNFEDENVKDIGKVLKKYYHLQKIGIKNIYDYNF